MVKRGGLKFPSLGFVGSNPTSITFFSFFLLLILQTVCFNLTKNSGWSYISSESVSQLGALLSFPSSLVFAARKKKEKQEKKKKLQKKNGVSKKVCECLPGWGEHPWFVFVCSLLCWVSHLLSTRWFGWKIPWSNLGLVWSKCFGGWD